MVFITQRAKCSENFQCMRVETQSAGPQNKQFSTQAVY